MKLKFWQKSLLCIANIIFPSKIYGKENIPDGKVVIVSNHFSVVDPVQYLNIGKDRPYYLAKKEIAKNKFSSWLFRSFGAIPIDRDKPDMKAMLGAIRVLKDNQKLLIFPEGTRNKTGTSDLQPLKGGAGVFSTMTKAPIVPCMILKKTRAFRKTKIIIGKPFELCEFYDKKLSDEDILAMDVIISEKMIAEHEKLKRICSKKKR